MRVNPKKTLSKEEVEYLLSIHPDDITLNLLQELFSDTYDRKTKKRKYNYYN